MAARSLLQKKKQGRKRRKKKPQQQSWKQQQKRMKKTSQALKRMPLQKAKPKRKKRKRKMTKRMRKRKLQQLELLAWTGQDWWDASFPLPRQMMMNPVPDTLETHGEQSVRKQTHINQETDAKLRE